VSNPRHQRRGVRGAEDQDAKSMEFEAPKAWTLKHQRRRGSRRQRCQGVQNGGGGIPLSSRLRGLGERRKLPQLGPRQSPSEKRFYCFLSTSERVSLQRLSKINVVHSQPQVEKIWFAQWVCSDPLRQLPQ